MGASDPRRMNLNPDLEMGSQEVTDSDPIICPALKYLVACSSSSVLYTDCDIGQVKRLLFVLVSL
jgi:hypothetical protein